MTEETRLGRPPYEPTTEEREKVRVLKAGGMRDAAIAVAIGISVPTLTKYYSLELEEGGAKVQADVLMARYRAAMGGNVTAQNKLIEQIGLTPPRPVGRPRSDKAEPIGKKQAADDAAQTAHEDTSWESLVQH